MVYRINNVEVDVTKACLRRNGEETRLKPKSFRLLVYFLENRDRLVTKEEVMDLFWKDTAVTDDALTQCVVELRKALGDSPRESTYLKTVPRRGYRFIGPVEEVPAEEVFADSSAVEPAANGIAIQSALPVEPDRKIRWMLAGAAVGLLSAAVVWLGTALFPSASANRIIPAKPQQWEVAWWKLNEGSGSKISDSIHGLTATLPLGVSWTSGIAGGGLLFAGHELVVRGADPGGVLPKGDGPRTLTAWVKTRSTNADSTAIFIAGDATPDSASGFSLGLHESGMAAFSTEHDPLLGKARIDDDRWHQITGVFEGSMRLFVDGMEQSSGTTPKLTPVVNSQWTLGTGFMGGTTFHGIIDDVRVFERALRPDEIHSLYRCLATPNDLQLEGRGSYRFSPVFGDSVEFPPRARGEVSARLRNAGTDFAGVSIAQPESDCRLSSIHGADIGQDLNIEAEVRAPLGTGGAITDAGPFFRSRAANPGDGIIGGTSAGYWVRLDSTGQVRVQRLHPNAMIAFSDPPEKFDPAVFHKLEAAVHGESLEVALDGRVLTFDASGVRAGVLAIPPAWESATPKGVNGGSAGIAFSCTRNRGKAGGQEARNIQVRPYRSLVRD